MIQLSLKKSLLISTAVYLILLVLVSLSSLSRISDMQQMAVTQQNKAVLVQQQATQIQLNLLQQIKLSSASLAAANEGAVKELSNSYQALQKQFQQNLAAFRQQQQQQISEKLLNQLVTNTNNYNQSANALFGNTREIYVLTDSLDVQLLKFEQAADELGAQILDIAYGDHGDNSAQVEAIANQLDTALFTIIGIAKEVYSLQKLASLQKIEESLAFALSDYQVKKDYLLQNLQPQDVATQTALLDKLAAVAFAYMQGRDGLIKIKKHLLENIQQQKVLHQTGEGQVNAALEVADKIKLVAEQTMSDIQLSVGKSVDAAKQMAVTIMLISLAVGAVTYWLTIKAIITPISGIARVVSAIASGDLTRKLRSRGSDELGLLSNDINKMTDNLLSLVKLISDVSRQLNGSAQLAFDKNSQLGRELNATLELTEQTLRNSQDVEQSAQKVSSDLEVFASHMDENVGHIQNSRNSCVTTRKLVTQLNAQALQSGGNIEQLKLRSSEINDIADTIEKIAEQTNLLALNAAIEAARAGELGRGFAVVADEVRELASRTQNSTLKIQSIITELLKEIDCAYTSMQTSIETSGKVADSIGSLDSSMEQINQEIESIQSEFGQTLSALKYQSKSMGVVNSSVAKIENIADKNVATAQEAVVQSKQISTLSEKLSQVIQRFKIE